MNELIESKQGDLTEHEVGAVAAAEREKQELQSSMAMAKQFPRDEIKGFYRLMLSCQRPSFAAGAFYSFPRGGSRVEGPSVKLAREMARLWGNLRHGIRIVSIDDQYAHVAGWCLDLETNVLVANEAKFKCLVQRKVKGKTQWMRPDERDLRELINKHGAICVRNAILQVLPPDFVEEALGKTKQTQQQVASGQLKQDKQGTIRALVQAFRAVDVSPEMIETKLEHDLSDMSAEEIVELRAIWVSLRDGNSSREEHFEPAAKAKKATVESGSISLDKLKAKAPAPKPVAEKEKADHE